MMKKRLICLCFVCLILSGCGVKSNVIVPYHPDQSLKLSYFLSSAELTEVPDEVLETMRTQLSRRLSEINLLALQGESGFNKADILITGYRMRHGAAKALVGIMAGCDNIRSKVTVTEPNTGKTIGISSFESSECSAVIPAQSTINRHIQKIVDYLSGK